MAIKGMTNKGLSFPQIGRIKKGEMRPTKKTKNKPKNKQVMVPFDLDYFKDGGRERRKYTERRRSEERRSDWVRVRKWCSVYVGKV